MEETKGEKQEAMAADGGVRSIIREAIQEFISTEQAKAERELAAAGAPDSVDYIKAAAPVQKLLSPAEMGELFKVLALARTEGIAWPGFALGERSPG